MKNISKTQEQMNTINKQLLRYNTIRNILDPSNPEDLGILLLIEHYYEKAVNRYLELNRKWKVEKSGLRLVSSNRTNIKPGEEL